MVAGVPQCHEGHGSSQQGDPYRDSLSPDPMGRRCPEKNRQKHIQPGRRNQKGFSIDVGVKHSSGMGDTLPCQQSQP